MTRIFPVLMLTLIICTACSDPQHGAWKVKSGIWLLIIPLIGLALAVAADVVVRHRRVGAS